VVRIVRFFGFPQILQAKVLLAIYIFYSRPFLSAEKLVDCSIQAGDVGIGLLDVDDSGVRIKGLAECERFYPAFQYLVWGGKSPTEAFGAAIIDPIGEA